VPRVTQNTRFGRLGLEAQREKHQVREVGSGSAVRETVTWVYDGAY
jgi:hypothetical protein